MARFIQLNKPCPFSSAFLDAVHISSPQFSSAVGISRKETHLMGFTPRLRGALGSQQSWSGLCQQVKLRSVGESLQDLPSLSHTLQSHCTVRWNRAVNFQT